jgi:hypothetical protein
VWDKFVYAIGSSDIPPQQGYMLYQLHTLYNVEFYETLNYDVGRTRKEKGMVSFKVLSKILPRGTKGTPLQESSCP